jgi:hypothetical protein
MGALVAIAAWSLPGFGLVTLAVQFLALWVGSRVGRFQRRRSGGAEADPSEGVGVVWAACSACSASPSA